MYEYIKGLITAITPAYLVLESQAGVAYRLYTANPYRFDEGQNAQVYVEQIVRENEMTLYGFASANEKAVFEKLLAVSGIGPKSALAILAGDDLSGVVAAIEAGDVNFLVQFPGVGKKTAQQIVLDLQGKLDELKLELGTASAQAVSPQQQSLANWEDAAEALLALGYKKKDIQKIASQLEGKADTTEDYISQALRLLVH
ncbi:Holliday junction branch migration protein RuvA [Eupransor demetentiae]|uniref:Holliday junction branch migration complex subunit RuvA n=1 Tax=Eupransor demetentiae TaxID=3109584 RepID=A0ABP0ENF8_9LACO|nr:Holliday junction resolvasome RuvABC DNA-binding subunit (RuvA) [Lactobacillaceae bacterium LMG 33000]